MKHCWFQADFTLLRDGTATLAVDDEMEIAPDAPALPDDPDEKRHMKHILAAQLFYFLKDIGHRHKHHKNRTDTIVDVYEIEENNDLDWRLGTLYSLYR